MEPLKIYQKLQGKGIIRVFIPESYFIFSKKLVGNLVGKHLVRINLKHRLVYEILEDEKVIKTLRMCSHYKD